MFKDFNKVEKIFFSLKIFFSIFFKLIIKFLQICFKIIDLFVKKSKFVYITTSSTSELVKKMNLTNIIY
jgi:hypothetical protein